MILLLWLPSAKTNYFVPLVPGMPWPWKLYHVHHNNPIPLQNNGTFWPMASEGCWGFPALGEQRKRRNCFLSPVEHGCASAVMPETAIGVRTLPEGQPYRHAEQRRRLSLTMSRKHWFNSPPRQDLFPWEINFPLCFLSHFELSFLLLPDKGILIRVDSFNSVLTF